ncbi:MAG: SUMF1/EgtB/PvdO family nonheme iron enzyme [Chloroflexi bacterium]|nr:SUMF1/EgtB/PvdO family nonheme iron enzyme [Chloroflexota bacterium]
MSHIFISYSRENQTYAGQLVDELLRRGFDVWIDDRIDFGDNWEREIFKAIDMCAAFIVIMTPASYASDWVLRECQYAEKRKKPPFPVLLEHEEFPRYISTQYVDVRTGELPPDSYFARLARVIKPKGERGEEIVSLTTTGSALRARKPQQRLAFRQESLDEAVHRMFSESPRIVQPEWVGKIIPKPFDWCFVPAGYVSLKPSGNLYDYLKEDQRFHLSDFVIARYPITQSQFQLFVNAHDGWTQEGWWSFSDAAIQWRSQNTPPPAGSSDRYPQTSVNWYSAIAFTHWLSARTNEKITLPTDQQWQRAAQGDDGRIYPWGDEFDNGRCNTFASQSGSLTPVTQYVDGASPYGVIDMSGNSWEYCLTDFRTGGNDLFSSNARVIRGGSWYTRPDVARAVVRGYAAPEYPDSFHSFRVARTIG